MHSKNAAVVLMAAALVASAARGQTLIYGSNPNPNCASAYLIGNAGNSNYRALQAQFRRRPTNGLQALVSYGWSYAIDTGSYGEYSNRNLADVNANRGGSDFDIRHQFSGAVTYNVPLLRISVLTRAITGGWALDDIVQIHSSGLSEQVLVHVAQDRGTK